MSDIGVIEESKTDDINNDIRSYFVSWSGGKDSCLALYRATQLYGKPYCLVNMLTEDAFRSRSHRLSKLVLEEQARLLGSHARN